MRSWCGLYGGVAYMLTPESSFDDFGVVRLVNQAAYIPKITVSVLLKDTSVTARIRFEPTFCC